MTLAKKVPMKKCTPHFFIYQTPIIDTNCRVIITPKISGTKSPKRLIEGVNNNGNDSKINTMQTMLATETIFGLST